MNAPLRIFRCSHEAAGRLGGEIASLLGERPYVLVAPAAPGLDADVAFVTREVTGMSTKHELQPATRATFYEAMEGAPSTPALGARAPRPAPIAPSMRALQ